MKGEMHQPLKSRQDQIDPHSAAAAAAGVFADVFNQPDPVNHPSHYTSHPSGIECIQVTEHFNFCLGNAIKYLWRADSKNDATEDLKKAIWYIERELQKRANT